MSGAVQGAAASALDQALASQAMAEVPLLPTPFNLSPVHIPADDLLHFIALQQLVQQQLGIRLPLLNGVFILVNSSHLHPQQAPAAPATQQQSGSAKLERASVCSSSADSAAVAAAIPWRLRQVSAVEAAPGVDPADASLVLVGGDRVRAGAVHEGQLADVQDHEYLCCEVGALQHAGRLRQLRVFDVAHIAWRLKVACSVEEEVMLEQQQQQQQWPAGAVSPLQSALREMPPKTWICEQILQHVDLYAGQQPAPPNQPQQLPSAEQYTQLLQGAATAWQHYVQHKLAGQQVQPLPAPWLPLGPLGLEQQHPDHHPNMQKDQQQQVQQHSYHPDQHQQQSAAQAQPSCSQHTAAAAGSAVAQGVAAAGHNAAVNPVKQQQGQQQQQGQGQQQGQQQQRPPALEVPAAASPHGPHACSRNSSSPSLTRRQAAAASGSRGAGSDADSPKGQPGQSPGPGTDSKEDPAGRHSNSSSGSKLRLVGNALPSPKDASPRVEAETQAWLQQLAVLLDRQPPSPSHALSRQHSSADPPAIDLAMLRLRLPLPPLLHDRYGSVGGLVSARAELGRGVVDGEQQVFVRPEFQAALLEAAARGSHSPGRGASPSARGRSRSRSASRSRSRGRSVRERTRARRRSRSRSRSRRGRKRTRAGGRSFSRGRSRSRSRRRREEPRDHSAWGPPPPRSGPMSAAACHEVQVWLHHLSRLLDPGSPPRVRPGAIPVAELRSVLPVPAAAMAHYGSVWDFLTDTPALRCIEGWVELEPVAHQRLRRAPPPARRHPPGGGGRRH